MDNDIDDFILLLGDPEWDRQHYQFHHLLARLEEVQAQYMRSELRFPEEARHDLGRDLTDLLRLALRQFEQHCHWEDQLMGRLPKDAETEALCAAHRKDHALMTKKLYRVMGEVEKNGIRTSINNLGSILFERLVSHVMRHDLPLRDALLSRGCRLGNLPRGELGIWDLR